MIRAYGAGTDKAHRGAGEHLCAHPGDGADQQHVRIGYRGMVDKAPWQAGKTAELTEKFVQQGDVFISNDMHGSSASGIGVIVGADPAAVQPPGYPSWSRAKRSASSSSPGR